MLNDGAVPTALHGNAAAHFAVMTRRRVLFGGLVLVTTTGLSAWVAAIVAADGFGLLDCLLVLAFAIKALWVALVFWSAAIGFAVRPTSGAPHEAVLPSEMLADADAAITVRTAIVMTIRDEDVSEVFARLFAIEASIDSTGFAAAFDYFLLSDSTIPEFVAAEQRELATWRERSRGGALTYRHRERNIDFKAGNLRDFCDRWGANYELMIVLDADSVMSGDAIVRLVRIMQATPRLGILQSMIDCVLPSSVTARIFEFGHRHVWHNYILGSAWWQGARGQYRGHNAAIRVSAYAAYARLSDRDGGAATGNYVMCVDQIEAALLYRAGYEVRELPTAGGSYEGLPPALPDYLVRYQRWCQGNLKNLRLVRMHGLSPMDVYHFVGVAHRFLGWPASVLFVALSAWTAISWPSQVPFPVASAVALYGAFWVLYFAPRIFGLIDAGAKGAHRYDGGIRLALGGAIEIVFTLLFLPVAMVAVTWSMIMMLFGGRTTWAPQRRRDYELTWPEAVRLLWPPTALGFALLIPLALSAPAALPWFLPFLGGLLFAIPFAVFTSSRRLTALMERHRLCAIPEEIAPPPELATLSRRDCEGRVP
jgi:membrane glycosyltransferase